MQQQTTHTFSRNFFILLVIAIAANVTGLFNDILEPDGALYASIAKNIVTKNDWVNLYAYGGDWLDKPHFPFWLSAISFKIFGINAFAYKLPSFICFLVGVLYTYKLSFKIYSKELAQLATLIYATSLHIILCNFDVRAEGYLTAFVIASIYHFYCAIQHCKWFKHIVAAAVFAAFAIMTKGIFVLITIASGFIIYWIASKQWKQFVNPKWYLLLILIFVFIAPELYCLYKQFDIHPEKIVFGKTNVSGIKFFFWDSQFGRFFNTGPIQGSGDKFFFIHTTLWAFLPWAVYLFIDVFKRMKNFKPNNTSPTLIINASALITFIMFSVSKFQLPHYIVIIFPLLSIIVARYLLEAASNPKELRILNYVQHFVFFILIFFIAAITVFYKLDNIWIPLIFATVVTQFFIRKIKDKSLDGIVIKALCFSSLLALFLNLSFYPNLMQYQAGMMAGKWQQKNLPNKTIAMLRCNEFSFDFYGNTLIKRDNDLLPLLKNDSVAFVFTPKKEIERINTDSFNVNTLKSFSYFHITELEAKFINAATRYQTLDTFVIASVSLKK
jgi:4-amino-4-deoxy-L-arabinose transferase-like glycosyltransferase